LEGVEIIYCSLQDINDLKLLIHDRDIDVFYHLAWVGVSTTLKNEYDIQIGNIKSTYETILVANSLNCSKFVCTGSVSEYAYANKEITGYEAPSPSDLYAASKVSAHFLCDIYARQSRINLNWALISSIYGPGRLDNNLVTYSIKSLLRKEAPKYTKLEQLWDYIYISDLAKALYLIGKNGKENKVYPIGSGEKRPLHEYVQIIKNLIDPDLKIEIGALPYKTETIDNSIVDITELRNDTGFNADVRFKDGISTTISWFKDNKKYL
jgi:nucleoside-diphosphate-sugar epimerase